MSSTISTNEPSIFIPHIFPNVSERVEEVFINLFGDKHIDRVDIITHSTSEGEICRAYVHFKSWPSTVEARNMRRSLLNGECVKVTYDEPWFWKCVISKLPKQKSTTPSPRISISYDDEKKPTKTSSPILMVPTQVKSVARPTTFTPILSPSKESKTGTPTISKFALTMQTEVVKRSPMSTSSWTDENSSDDDTDAAAVDDVKDVEDVDETADVSKAPAVSNEHTSIDCDKSSEYIPLIGDETFKSEVQKIRIKMKNANDKSHVKITYSDKVKSSTNTNVDDDLSDEEKKNKYGGVLYTSVVDVCPLFSAKVTGMLLEMPSSELEIIVNDATKMRRKINMCCRILRDYFDDIIISK